MDPDDPDDEAPALPSPGTHTSRDVDDAMRLLAWCRERGFALPSLRVGTVDLGGVRDLRPHLRDVRSGAAEPREESDIWAQHGAVVKEPPR